MKLKFRYRRYVAYIDETIHRRHAVKKESALYRFVYTMALLAVSTVIYGTGMLGMHSALADIALADHATPSSIVTSAVYLTLFIALAAAALAFTIVFNARSAVGLLRNHSSRVHKAPRVRWAIVPAAACALFLVLRFGIPGIGLLDVSQLRLGIVFFFLPFLWEYLLGFGSRPAMAPAAAHVKPIISSL